MTDAQSGANMGSDRIPGRESVAGDDPAIGDPKIWGARLGRIVAQQRDLYQELDRLSASQGELIRAGRTDELLGVLGRRQELLEELLRLNEDVAPFVERWDQLGPLLPSRERLKLREQFDAVERLVDSIATRDEQDRAHLEEQRGAVARDLTGVAAGRGAVRAYAESGRATGPRYQDREGESVSSALPLAPANESASGTLSETELTALLRSFNDVTSKLQETHESLLRDVARLEGELGEAKDQLRRARQLAALGEMAAGIAHEIRNPLGSIKLYASALATDLEDRNPERELALKIDHAVTRLNGVVGDVLTFARDVRIRPETCSARELIRDALDSCADLWAAHGLEIRAPDEADDRSVSADPALMHQALVNVIRNAAEAMSEATSDGGHGVEPAQRLDLEIDERSALDADGRRGAMVVIVVRDTGPGVPQEVMARVFNPFFTTRHTGTGLGLAIVHRIVDAHGGRVVIRNNESGVGGVSRLRGAGHERVAVRRGATVELLLPANGPAGQCEEDGA